ncbi:hypothetical protein [Chryseobacterium sp.]|uniref:hypothetical protein n=1 Tax=Chryseobacterium sp. TaxID=1871047 RepID=UPI003890ACE9
MKNRNVLKILKNNEGLKNQRLYTELLKEYAAETNIRTVYYYQLGYTPEKLTGLIYDVKKHFEITDKDIALYNGDDEEEEKHQKDDTPPNPPVDDIPPVDPNAEILKKLNLQSVPDVMDGMKLRDEYPFLDLENTPLEIKALVTDKITAYKKYAATHAEILTAANNGEAEERLFELGKNALEQWNLNQEIKDELDFYRDAGKILGKHASLADLKMKQDVGEMSEAELFKGKSNAQKSISRYNGQGKSELVETWQKRLTAIEKRLIEDFKHVLKK